MSNNINFFTAVKYGQTPTYKESLIETVDNYFYLGGKKALVIQGKTEQGHENTILTDTNSSLLARVVKVFSYLTIILPLIMLIAKIALRSTHTFKLTDPKKDLEKGINITNDTMAKLQRLIPKIDKGEGNDEIIWLENSSNLVFKLKDSSDLIFKMAPTSRSVLRNGKCLNSKALSDQRFSNMIKAKEVCLAHQLGQLIIPHAQKIEIKVGGTNYTLIAEETLDLVSNSSAQKELYHKYSKELPKELSETARQLAIFIAKTGFNDVTPRNIPILNRSNDETSDEKSGPKIGLIDLEAMDSVENGFTGDENGSCGLIGCLSEEQIDVVIDEAKKQSVIISKSFHDAKEQRLEKLESNKQLRQFHENNQIITGKEPLKVDLDSLDLDLTENSKKHKEDVTFGQVTKAVITEINRLIEQSSEDASIKGKRYIVLNTNHHPFYQYNELGLPEGFYNAEQEKKGWMYRIIQALVDKGHLFKLDKINGHGYFIQA
jgi:hypothetical protein